MSKKESSEKNPLPQKPEPESKSNIREIFIDEGKSAKHQMWGKDKKKNKKKRLIIILVIIGLFLATLIGLYFWAKKYQPDWLKWLKPKTILIKQDAAKYPSLLTGEMKKTKVEANARPFAIAIENSPDARPQSGLAQAGLVYEAMTEGGITRFLAFFDKVPEEAGPVRSARTFFVSWAHELPAFFVHCGGNADAIEWIPTLSNFFDLDQFAYGSYFWRSSDRYAPHNLYTSGDNLEKLVKDQSWPANLDYPAWQFKDEEKTEKRGTGQGITIDFSSPAFAVKYTYNKEKNYYERLLANEPHLDIDGTPITVKNVALAYYDGELRDAPQDNTVSWYLETDKGGKAKVLLDGKVIDGTWTRSGDGRTRFFDASGSEIKFSRGNTWIEAIVGEATATLTPAPTTTSTPAQ
ncbi:MAG: DUF3048 domain-containing protein [Patescibacteria group bacterium]|nr:DUF3048 domain-containing protein [Patescibacteria group bacterium]